MLPDEDELLELEDIMLPDEELLELEDIMLPDDELEEDTFPPEQRSCTASIDE